MDMNIDFEPSPDFVSKTMRRIDAYEDARDPFFRRVGMYNLQRCVLVISWALFGLLNATRVF